ncbi:MAG: gliding motility-associated ABC transporter permease subunit GldF [Bacteroidales bacterium]|nr:gliding motility-associated ABC transporter permease subunit GldF [Bacteroidales bacterium]
MWVLFRKEVSNFFSTILGYVVIFFFLLANGLLIWVFRTPLNILEGNYASLDPLFMMAPWVFLFLIPAITMRMFADEKKLGTLELLLSRPVTETTLVLSKFFASWLLAILAILPTLLYFFSVWKLGSPPGNIDTGGTWGSYIGLFLLAGVYASIGVFASSLTDNQAVAFVMAVFFSLLVTWGFDQLATVFNSGSLGFTVSRIGLLYHYESVSRGVIDSRDLVWFFGVMVIFNTSSRTVLLSRKW